MRGHERPAPACGAPHRVAVVWRVEELLATQEDLRTKWREGGEEERRGLATRQAQERRVRHTAQEKGSD